MRQRKKTAILISGRGSNMSALLRAAADADFPAKIVAVISDNADAPGLKAAEAAGVPALAVPSTNFTDRISHERALEAVLAEREAELICLAGFMRLLSAGFVARREGRMLNIHPSLLPLFPGLHTHARAIEAGMRVHGCTVHFVTPQMDAGPIIAQAAVPVLPGDTADALAERVLQVEHRLYPLALALVASGKARMESGRTVFSNAVEIGWGERSTLLVPSSIEDKLDLEDLARLTP